MNRLRRDEDTYIIAYPAFFGGERVLEMGNGIFPRGRDFAIADRWRVRVALLNDFVLDVALGICVNRHDERLVGPTKTKLIKLGWAESDLRVVRD
jgi:hypothetical protein